MPRDETIKWPTFVNYNLTANETFGVKCVDFRKYRINCRYEFFHSLIFYRGTVHRKKKS